MRKILALLVFVAVSLLATGYNAVWPANEAAAEGGSAYLGDINEDGKVNMADLLELLGMLSAEPDTGYDDDHHADRKREMANVDESDDGRVDVFDLLGMLQIVAGKESPKRFTPQGPVKGRALDIPMVSIPAATFIMGQPAAPLDDLLQEEHGHGDQDDDHDDHREEDHDGRQDGEDHNVELAGEGAFDSRVRRDNQSHGDLRDFEAPAHDVSLSAFEISMYEITYAQYADFLNEALAEEKIIATAEDVLGTEGIFKDQPYIDLSGGHHSNSKTDNKCWISFDGERFSVEPGKERWPVVFVTWFGAKAFAIWYGLDLPTEAEWEYAASGGRGYKFGTDDGSLDCSNANYLHCSHLLRPVNIGSYAPNPFGLYDMSGNAWEWCEDWFSTTYYANSPDRDPMGPDSGAHKVGRGGCWFTHAIGCRTVHRYPLAPDGTDNAAGIRVVRR